MELALPRALRPQLAARGGFGLHRGSELRHRPVPLLLQLHALVVAGLSKICQLSFPRTLRTCCTRKLLAQLCSGCISTSLRGQLLGAEALAELRGLGRTCFCQVLQLPGPAEREALPLLRSLGPEAELLEVLAERDRLLGVLRPLHGARAGAGADDAPEGAPVRPEVIALHLLQPVLRLGKVPTVCTGFDQGAVNRGVRLHGDLPQAVKPQLRSVGLAKPREGVDKQAESGRGGCDAFAHHPLHPLLGGICISSLQAGTEHGDVRDGIGLHFELRHLVPPAGCELEVASPDASKYHEVEAGLLGPHARTHHMYDAPACRVGVTLRRAQAEVLVVHVHLLAPP
mmetsp:Transcript_55671/g.172732  ORF Transcript_55671/g.172732 Transcript_55671/m.172732 type:complete len:342 (-) Transcript_55671:80-1105(-)